MRVLPEDELGGVANPERGVDLAIPRRIDGASTVRTPRLTPADLVGLRTETDLAPAGIRTDVMRARTRGANYSRIGTPKGRAAVEANQPDLTRRSRVLDGLRAFFSTHKALQGPQERILSRPGPAS